MILSGFLVISLSAKWPGIIMTGKNRTIATVLGVLKFIKSGIQVHNDLGLIRYDFMQINNDFV